MLSRFLFWWLGYEWLALSRHWQPAGDRDRLLATCSSCYSGKSLSQLAAIIEAQSVCRDEMQLCGYCAAFQVNKFICWFIFIYFFAEVKESQHVLILLENNYVEKRWEVTSWRNKVLKLLKEKSSVALVKIFFFKKQVPAAVVSSSLTKFTSSWQPTQECRLQDSRNEHNQGSHHRRGRNCKLRLSSCRVLSEQTHLQV